MQRESFVFDLDGTLCTPNLNVSNTTDRYYRAEPITEMIDYVNKLYDQGHEIIIHTARRMVTHKGDVQKVIEDVGNVTTIWLKENNVKYTSLVFGKPYASAYYIDDKAMNIEDFKKWMKTK